jgi:hypothetical protein
LYQTTCFQCFARYKKCFESPQVFRNSMSGGGGVCDQASEDILQAVNAQLVDTQLLINEAEEEEMIDVVVLDGAVEGRVDDAEEEQEVPFAIISKDSIITRTEKNKKRRDFLKKLTLNQCVIENLPDGDNTRTPPMLVSVGGIPLSKFLLSDLQFFCAAQKISGYRQKKKLEVSQLIAARVASDHIYASLGPRFGMHDSSITNNTSKKKTPNYRSKTVRPKAVTKTGSYFRIINLWFSAQNRHLVLRTGKKMNRAELDIGGYRHKSIWDNLAEQYNNNTGIADFAECDGDDKNDNSYLDVIQTPHMLYDLENPEDFDRLEGRDVAQFVRWITHQYYVVHKSVSGDHARFEDRVGEKSYLLYFHNMITASGAENLESLMKAELSLDVFSESSVNGFPVAVQETVTGTNLHTPAAAKQAKKRGRFLSNTKEQTDIAILRFISRAEEGQHNTEESSVVSGGGALLPSTSTTSTATSSARCNYIREKTRMAKEVFDLRIATSNSDAVDTSLKKWKASLKELRELKEDDGIGVYHPIYIATKAAADLHEATFNSCLARATRVQQQSSMENRNRNEQGGAPGGARMAFKTASSSITSSAALSDKNEEEDECNDGNDYCDDNTDSDAPCPRKIMFSTNCNQEEEGKDDI